MVGAWSDGQSHPGTQLGMGGHSWVWVFHHYAKATGKTCMQCVCSECGHIAWFPLRSEAVGLCAEAASQPLARAA